MVWQRTATEGYFRAMGIAIRSGREFTLHDGPSGQPVVIVTESLARRYWPGEDPVGKHLGFGLNHRPAAPGRPEPTWFTVVGVAGDMRPISLAQAPGPEVFLPHRLSPARSFKVVLRTSTDPATFATALRQVVREIDPDLPVSQIASMEDVLSRSITPRRLTTLLLGALAGLALVLAVIGVYGVVSYTAAQRMHEMGVRIALGAGRQDVMGLVVRDAFWSIVPGLCAGLAGAFAVTRIMSSILYEVSPSDPFVFGSAPLILVAVALIAAYIPARRAAKADPMTALRYE